MESTRTAATSVATTTEPNLLLPPGTKLGEVHLAVTDGEEALRFWSGVLGLRLLAERDGAYHLGADDVVIVLHPGASAPVARRRTGLYHVALHIPTRRELARVVARLMSLRYPNSPTDHLVSETTYLSDPDGNGIELTLERPERGELLVMQDGSYGGRTAEGEWHSGREPVGLESLFGELAQDEDLNAPLQVAGVHHVHLHVANLEESQHFYGNVIGFRPQLVMPAMQMVDFGLSDSNPVHTLALNTWSGVGAAPAPADTAGLRRFTLVLPSSEALREVAARLDSAALPYEERDGGISVLDPSGNRLQLVNAAS